MKTSLQILIIAFTITMSPVAGTAADLELRTWFGGSIVSPNPSFKSEVRSGSTGGSHVVGVDLAGPALVWQLRPLLSYEYHWDGGKDSYLNAQSDMIGFGVMRSVPVGHAKASLSLSATHFSDSYSVLEPTGNRVEYLASKWGMSVGVDLRFKFFEKIDSVIGYKFNRREKPVFESGGIFTERSYILEGWETSHSIFAGLVFGLGDL